MNTGKRLAGKDSDGNYRQSHDETAEAPKLSDIGISKSMSSRAQTIALCCNEFTHKQAG